MIAATQSSFPRSGVGTHWRTLRRPDPRRWSGWTAFPRRSVGTIKYLAPQQCIDPWAQALLAKASTEHVPVAVGCAERKAKRISRERCASRCSAHPMNCLVSKGKAEEKLQALEAYLSPSNNFTGLIKACFEAHKVGQLFLKRLASFPIAA